MHDIYIGWDAREAEAFQVCKYSLEKRSSDALHIVPLRQKSLRYSGLYRRAPEEGTRIDQFDGKPYSTGFSFTRFLVPTLQQYEGWALFVDCDFLFLDDISNLFSEADDSKAVMVVKHDYRPEETTKMDDVPQEVYERKNWSSLILWNCSHPSNRKLTVDAVNTQPGSWLHGFSWLDDEEIGSISHEWNVLEGPGCLHCSPYDNPDYIAAVHYTRGGPWFTHKPPEGMNLESWNDVGNADLWLKERASMSNLLPSQR